METISEQFDLRHAFSEPMFMASHESPLLTIPETAEYLNRTDSWVRQVLRYEIPVVKLGVRVYFEKRELDAFIAAGREVPTR